MQGWERAFYSLYKSNDPSPTIPTYGRKEEKRKTVKDKKEASSRSQ